MKGSALIGSLLLLLIAGVLVLCVPAIDARQAGPATAAKRPRMKVTDTLGCVFDARGDEGATDPVYPIGGIVKGKWVGGRYWRRKVPHGAKLTVYSLTQGPVGSLRITGLASWQGMLELNVFDGFKGEWRLDRKGEVGRIRDAGMDESMRFGTFLVALWRRDGSKVSWCNARLLDREQPDYRKIARDYVGSRWVRDYLVSHGLPVDALDDTQIVQLLSVDLDGDQRDEVLMSVYWERHDQLWDRCHLLMVKTLPTGKQQVVALANHDHSPLGRAEQVLGCADIDNDGRAEVITCYVDDTPAEAFHIYRSDERQEVAEYKIIYGE